MVVLAVIQLATIIAAGLNPSIGHDGATGSAEPTRGYRGWAKGSLLVALALFLYVGVETVFAGWSAAIPAGLLDLDGRSAAIGTSTFWILMGIGRYATWFVLKTRVRPLTQLVVTSMLAGAFLGIAAAASTAYPSMSLVAVGAAVVCLGPSYSLILGVGLTRIPAVDARQATSLLVACGAAGGAMVPAFILTVSHGSVGPIVFIVTAGLALFISVLVAIPGRSPEQTSPVGSENVQ